MLANDGDKSDTQIVAAKPSAANAITTIRSGLQRISKIWRQTGSAGCFCQAARIVGAESSPLIGMRDSSLVHGLHTVAIESFRPCMPEHDRAAHNPSGLALRDSAITIAPQT